MEQKEQKKEGVYLSNFVATSVSFFILVLAFAAGFFAKAYFGGASPAGNKPTTATANPAKPADTDAILKYLGKAVDQNKIKSCLDSGKYDNRISEDTKLGDSLGVGGTPGFFINNKNYAGAYSFTDMQPVVDYFLGKPTGKAPDQTTLTMDQIKDAFGKSIIKIGDDSRKVIFLEFSDPSCPYCSIASGQNGELNIQAGDRFKLVKDGGSYVAPVVEMRKLAESGEASYALAYRNGHGNGEKAMKILYCAFDQGKFWQAHDLIMSKAGYALLNGQ